MQHIDTILIVMVAIYGLSVLLNVCVLLGLWIGANKAAKAAKVYAEELHAKLDPVLHSTHELVGITKDLINKLEPKLEAAAGDLADITRAAREETARIKESTSEITDRIRRQAERVESMANDALNSVDRVGHFINNTVSAPVKQVTGVVAAARAILETLRKPSPPRRPRPEDDPEERSRRERQQYV
jgi:methyl-accepting chemotaxis protein